MLEEQINGFIEYCKVSGFRDKSIESLSIRLNQFNNFLKTARLRKIKSITYHHLSGFVADYTLSQNRKNSSPFFNRP